MILPVVSSAQAATYRAEGDLAGEITYYVVGDKDNLYELARRNDIGIVEMLVANPGIDPWLPGKGTRLTLSTSHILPDVPREGIVINLAELRLFYFIADNNVMTFPIGIGREGWQTPTGSTAIVGKRRNPAWVPPASIRREKPDLPEVIPPGPDNPLGQYALYLGWKKYLIHGTNKPHGVGRRVSHGCIRLYPEDIEALFHAVNIGTKVTVIDTPYKLGWRKGILYLEVTPTQSQADIVMEYRRLQQITNLAIYDAVRKKAAEKSDIDWYAVERAILYRSGIPIAIGKKK